MGYTRSAAATTARVRSVRRVLRRVLALNLLVAGAKLGWGTFTGSVAMVADGFHSLFDSASNIIGLVGMRLASRRPDAGHPYGHSKYETAASAAIGALLVIAAYKVGSSAIERLLEPGDGPRVGATSFAVMIVTLIINVLVTVFERRAGKRLGSDILLSDARHTASDVLVSLGVLGGLVAVRLGYPIADPIIGLVVAGFIVVAALRVFGSVNATLSDMVRIPPAEVCAAALTVDGVLGCHEVRTRGTSGEVYVDFHVQVDPTASVEAGHAIAEEVERVVCDRFPMVVDVIAHLEPYDEYQRRKTSDQADQGLE